MSKTSIRRTLSMFAIIGMGLWAVSCADPRGMRPRPMPKSAVVNQDQAPNKGTLQPQPQPQPTAQPPAQTPPGVKPPGGTPAPAPTGTPTPAPGLSDRDLFLQEAAQKLATLENPAPVTQDQVNTVLQTLKSSATDAGNVIKGITITHSAVDTSTNQGDVSIKAFLVLDGEPTSLKASGKLQWSTPDQLKMVKLDSGFTQLDGTPITQSVTVGNVYATYCGSGTICPQNLLVSLVVELIMPASGQHILAAFGQDFTKDGVVIRSSIQTDPYMTAEQAEIAFKSTPTPTPTPTPSSVPTPDATPSAAPTPAVTPTPSATPTPDATPTPAPIATPSAAPTAVPTPGPTPSAAPTPDATSTPTPAFQDRPSADLRQATPPGDASSSNGDNGDSAVRPPDAATAATPVVSSTPPAAIASPAPAAAAAPSTPTLPDPMSAEAFSERYLGAPVAAPSSSSVNPTEVMPDVVTAAQPAAPATASPSLPDPVPAEAFGQNAPSDSTAAAPAASTPSLTN